MNLKPNWIEYTKPNYRDGFLALLAELSNYHNANFIIIGATALLIQNFLDYPALWDIDLLFRSRRALSDFADQVKNYYINFDSEMQVGKTITSYKTSWKKNRIWYNVDMIIKDKVFYDLLKKNSSVYKESVKYQKKTYHLRLPLANPIDILADKLSSPRLHKDLEEMNSLGTDIRHIFRILGKHRGNRGFYEHLGKSGAVLGKLQNIKISLKKLTDNANYFGFQQADSDNELLLFLKDG